jgi:hypothetical protein
MKSLRAWLIWFITENVYVRQSNAWSSKTKSIDLEVGSCNSSHGRTVSQKWMMMTRMPKGKLGSLESVRESEADRAGHFPTLWVASCTGGPLFSSWLARVRSKGSARRKGRDLDLPPPSRRSGTVRAVRYITRTPRSWLLVNRPVDWRRVQGSWAVAPAPASELIALPFTFGTSLRR